MAKVNLKSDKITPFGVIYYASKAFYALSLDKVINGTLGVRSSTYNGYQWDEIMSAMSDVFLCGGDCVEDVNRSECHLRESPEIRIPTSHTIWRAIKELSHEDMEEQCHPYSPAYRLRQESRSLSSTLPPYAPNGQGRQEAGG